MDKITHTLLSELIDDKSMAEDFEKYWSASNLKEEETGDQLYKIIKTAARTAYIASRVDFVEKKNG